MTNEKAYTISQIGTFPYESYEIRPDYEKIDYRLGEVPANWHTPLDFNPGQLYPNLNYKFVNLGYRFDDIGRAVLDISNQGSFYYSLSDVRKNFNGGIYNIFFVELEDYNFLGFTLHSNRLFLKPLSAGKTPTGWSLKTSAIMLSATPSFFRTVDDITETTQLSRNYNDNFANKIQLPLPNTILINYSLSSVQKFINKPIINFSKNYNPTYFTTNLENQNCKIKADSLYLTHTHEYIGTLGEPREIGNDPFYNNSERILYFDSSIWDYKPETNKNIETFLMLQSAINTNIAFSSPAQCMLSSVFDINSTNFKYYTKSILVGKNAVLLVSGKNETFLGVRYVADSPIFRNRKESVFSTLSKFENSKISSIFNSVSAKEAGADVTYWETKYPPHHYSYNLNFFDYKNIPNPVEGDSLYFDLSSKILTQDSTSCTLSTYLFSPHNVLTLDLETFGVVDQIKFEMFKSDADIATFYDSVSCYYGKNLNTYYDISASPWIPAASGANFKILLKESSYGDITYNISTKLSTYSGFLDSFYKTSIDFNRVGGNTVNIFQNLVDEGSDYIETTVEHLSTDTIYPFKALSNTYISWDFKSVENVNLDNCKIYLKEALTNTYTIIPRNSSVIFNDKTHTVRFSGFGPYVIIPILSSQKYNEFCTLTSNSTFFDRYIEKRFLIEKYGDFKNLNSTRVIGLTAALPSGKNVYDIPNTDFIYWSWEYNGMTNFDRITAVKQNGDLYNQAQFGTGSDLKYLKFYIEPDKNEKFPTINTFRARVQNSTYFGEYVLEIDDFPSDDNLTSNFLVYYPNFNTIIHNTADSKVLTRPYQNGAARYKFTINDTILRNAPDSTFYWKVSDNIGNTTLYNNVTSFEHTIPNPSKAIITLSTLNAIAAGWVSAHNVFDQLTLNSVLSSEFFKDLKFNVYSYYFWPSGKKVVLSTPTNYTFSLAPTAYKETNSRTYQFWASANKNFDTYLYSVDTPKTNSISLLKIPYNAKLETTTPDNIRLTAFNTIYPPENGLYFKMSSTGGLITNTFRITGTTNNTGGIFEKAPRVLPYNSNFYFTFSATEASIDIINGRNVNIYQVLSATSTNNPTEIVGGTVKYLLYTNNWLKYVDIPAQTGLYNIAKLSIGDSTIPLNVSNGNTMIYIVATPTVDIKIPETTFDDYPTTPDKNIWSTVVKTLTSSAGIQTISATITANNLEFFVSDYYTLTGGKISLSLFDYNIRTVDQYDVDFGDGLIETIQLDDLIEHQYDNAGTYTIELSAISPTTIKTSKQLVTVYNEWPIFDQFDFRFLDEKALKMPYTLDQIYIQPNEFGDVDIFNTSLQRLNDNLEYLKSNSKTLNTQSPSDIFGWFGVNNSNKADGARWNTIDYNSRYYKNYNAISTNGKDGTYFANIKYIKEGEHIFVLDGNTIRVFKNSVKSEEIEFVNYDELVIDIPYIKNIAINEKDNAIYASDDLKNIIYKIEYNISDISYIFSSLNIAGFGSYSDVYKFNSPEKLVFKEGYLYVLDYNNNCIKKYTQDLVWVATYYDQTFENNKIENFDVHVNGMLYTINTDGTINIFDQNQKLFYNFNVKNILTNLTIQDMSFDEGCDFIYIVNYGITHKFTATGVYIGTLDLPPNIIRNTPTKNHYMYSIYESYGLKWMDKIEFYSIGANIENAAWDISKILLQSDELASEKNYNRALKRITQNVKKYRDSIESKFVIATEAGINGTVTYFASVPVKTTERPEFSSYIENEEIGVGINELHIPQVCNRELKKVYDALEILEALLSITSYEVENQENCNSPFCWSWKAMSSYSLKLPTLKICNINPITWAELEKNFPIPYAPTKTWDLAESLCCVDIKSPLE